MDFPIADIACGYGRNGAFLVDKGYSCIFCDIDEDSLNYIIQGKNLKGLLSICKNLTYKKYQILLLHIL